MAISSEDFRNALRHFPAGVTIITIRSGEQIHGLTVSAFASISPDPPLVAVVIDHRHRSRALLDWTSLSAKMIAESDGATGRRTSPCYVTSHSIY
jgi:flavin reductase (DIM6/NTAB) family NADH-FMN oxidoreductase RutF